MLLLTLGSFLAAKSGLDSVALVALLLLTAFIKGQIIVDYFMQLKWAGMMWRIIALAWLLIVLLLIALLYFL
jgi:hypothetical protein